jgi:hypothetical protein
MRGNELSIKVCVFVFRQLKLLLNGDSQTGEFVSSLILLKCHDVVCLKQTAFESGPFILLTGDVQFLCKAGYILLFISLCGSEKESKRKKKKQILLRIFILFYFFYY